MNLVAKLWGANQKGFLMVEVIVATVIISVALVAISGMFINSTIANRKAADYTVAANLAQKQMELLKVQPSSYWAAISVFPKNISWQDSSETTPLSINNITYTITTTADVCSEDSNLVQVTVAVSWDDRGVSRALQLTTFYAKI